VSSLHRRAVCAELVVVAALATDEGVDSTFHDLLNVGPDSLIFKSAAVFHDRAARFLACANPQAITNVLQNDYALGVRVDGDVGIVRDNDHLPAPPAGPRPVA